MTAYEVLADRLADMAEDHTALLNTAALVEIGRSLDSLDGFESMMQAMRDMQDMLMTRLIEHDPALVSRRVSYATRQVSRAWHGIGDWQY